MNNKIINLEKIIKEKKINCSKNNMIFDLLDLTEVIQNKINESFSFCIVSYLSKLNSDFLE